MSWAAKIHQLTKGSIDLMAKELEKNVELREEVKCGLSEVTAKMREKMKQDPKWLDSFLEKIQNAKDDMRRIQAMKEIEKTSGDLTYAEMKTIKKDCLKKLNKQIKAEREAKIKDMKKQMKDEEREVKAFMKKSKEDKNLEGEVIENEQNIKE